MAWTDEAWKAIEDVYEKILNLEFVRELGDGTLSQERFLEYMVQDKLYLNDYARALALIAVRAPTAEDTSEWSQFSIHAATAETTIHDFYIKNFEVSDGMKSKLSGSVKSPSCELYTSFLLRHAALSSIEVAAAAVLPCFWIYDQVGRHHSEVLKSHPNKANHPYAKWIEMYGSDEFDEGTNKAKSFCDKLAEKTTPEVRQQMIDAFVRASVLELMFWKAAWDNEKWIA